MNTSSPNIDKLLKEVSKDAIIDFVDFLTNEKKHSKHILIEHLNEYMNDKKLVADEDTDRFCQYTFKKGKNLNTQCLVKLKPDITGSLCIRHRKYVMTIDTDISHLVVEDIKQVDDDDLDALRDDTDNTEEDDDVDPVEPDDDDDDQEDIGDDE